MNSKKRKNAMLSCLTDTHYTPIPIVEASRSLLGFIDLDPASDEIGNKIIKANHYFTRESNGLTQSWSGFATVFLNPPGGVNDQNRSVTPLWWDKFYLEWCKGSFIHGIFIGFSLEILSRKGYQILKHPFCIPQSPLITGSESGCISNLGRIKFDSWDGCDRISGSSPTHGNVISYLPPRHKPKEYIDKFEFLFSTFGEVKI